MNQKSVIRRISALKGAIRLVPALLIVGILGGCATRVVEQQAMPAATRAEGINVAQIEVTTAGGDVRSPGLPGELEAELRRAIAGRNQAAGRPAKLVVRIDHGRVASNAARFFAGAMVGRNRLMATVFLLDAATNATLSEFKIDRSSNPGGYGAFYDQERATARIVADAIADELFPSTRI